MSFKTQWPNLAKKAYQYILKRKLGNSSLPLVYEDKDGNKNNHYWVSDFDVPLVPGKEYEHSGFGKCKVMRIDIVPKVDTKKHLLFWFKVRPAYEVKLGIFHKDQGLQCWSLVSLEEFTTGLISSLNFENKLQTKVESFYKRD